MGTAGRGVHLPPGGSGQGAVPLPRIFLKFRLKTGHYLFKIFLCSGKKGEDRPVLGVASPKYVTEAAVRNHVA